MSPLSPLAARHSVGAERVLGWAGLAGVLACGTPPDATPPTEAAPTSTAASDPPGAATATTAPATTSPSSATSPGPATSAPVAEPERPLSVEPRFAPRDTRCSKDTDCAVTQRGVSQTLFCCDGCDSVAGAKAWVAKADAHCKAYAAGAKQHPCPPRDCTPPGPARCHQGRCELVPTRP